MKNSSEQVEETVYHWNYINPLPRYKDSRISLAFKAIMNGDPLT